MSTKDEQKEEELKGALFVAVAKLAEEHGIPTRLRLAPQQLIPGKKEGVEISRTLQAALSNIAFEFTGDIERDPRGSCIRCGSICTTWKACNRSGG